MSRPERFDILFEPITIGPKTMRNRFYQTPQCTGFGDVFPGGQAYHRGIKAEGGWAVVNTEATTIAPEFDWAGQMTPSRIWDDDDVANWTWMTDKIHEHGSLAGIELHAGGAFSTNIDSRIPARHIHGRIEEAAYFGSVRAMTKRDIREVQQLYLEAAKRSRSAGFDIVNIHGAEIGAVPVQFLMNVHNSRTDEYGGSLSNRARFWMETLEIVKEEVGDELAVAARFCVDSLHGTDAGIRVAEEGVGFIELANLSLTSGTFKSAARTLSCGSRMLDQLGSTRRTSKPNGSARFALTPTSRSWAWVASPVQTPCWRRSQVANSTSSGRPDPPSRTHSSPRRSKRADSRTYENASAATPACRVSISDGPYCARRTPRPARSTSAAGIQRTTRQHRTARPAC